MFRSEHLVIYGVLSPSSFETGPAPASVLSMSGTEVVLDLPAPGGVPGGRPRLAVLAVTRRVRHHGARRHDPVVVSRAGTVRLTVDIDPASALHVLVAGARRRTCAAPGA